MANNDFFVGLFVATAGDGLNEPNEQDETGD